MSKDINKTINLLKKFLKDVNAFLHVDKAILFGSHVHGRPNKNSDIDIAIFTREATDRNRVKLMSEALCVAGDYKADIQPLIFPYKDLMDDENDFIVDEIKKKGIEIKVA
jgi:predicted nucleotidyltransferase